MRDRHATTGLHHAIAFIAIAVGVLLAWSHLTSGLDRLLEDMRAGLRTRPASGHTALVEIDARSIAALDRWPWPRGLHARAIEAAARAGAQTIAFDVDFSARSSPAEDQRLAEAIAAARIPVVLASFRQAASQGSSMLLDNVPLPSLRRNALLGAVNIFADDDGLVRHYPYGSVVGGVPRPSLGAVLGEAQGRVDRSFPIDGAIDPASVPRISFVDLIGNQVDPRLINGRNLLVGATAIEMGDRYPVPRHGVLPGALIQVLAAETLRQGTAPFDHGALPALALVAAALAIVVRRCGQFRAAIMIGTAALLLGGPLLFEFGRLGTFDVAPALAALFLSEGLTLIADAIVAMRHDRLHDRETGLPNNAALNAVLARRPAVAHALVVLRLSNFPEIVGVLGQERAADFVGRLAERLAFSHTGTLYRVEDGALAWLISGSTTDQVALIEGTAALLRAPIEIASKAIELTFSFGLADLASEASATGDPIGHAILAADRAHARGMRWDRHSVDLERDSDWRLGLAAELGRALAHGDVWVAYQPKQNLRTGMIDAVEALVRWRHPQRGEIPPGDFIPALEEAGGMHDLTVFVLERALLDRCEWAARGHEINVAVNLSAPLLGDDGFMAALEELLARFPGEAGSLTLEVTESSALINSDTTVAALEKLVALGIKLSIDDYGTGQSTLTYLKRLPAREIKIDQSFVANLSESRSDQAMVRSTIDLAHELGCCVVAEGVETAETLELLTRFGCDVAQGWHVGRPVPASDLLARLTRQRGPVKAEFGGSDQNQVQVSDAVGARR